MPLLLLRLWLDCGRLEQVEVALVIVYLLRASREWCILMLNCHCWSAADVMETGDKQLETSYSSLAQLTYIIISWTCVLSWSNGDEIYCHLPFAMLSYFLDYICFVNILDLCKGDSVIKIVCPSHLMDLVGFQWALEIYFSDLASNFFLCFVEYGDWMALFSVLISDDTNPIQERTLFIHYSPFSKFMQLIS